MTEQDTAYYNSLVSKHKLTQAKYKENEGLENLVVTSDLSEEERLKGLDFVLERYENLNHAMSLINSIAKDLNDALSGETAAFSEESLSILNMSDEEFAKKYIKF